MLEELLSTRLIFVTGKGGVGKSTVAGAVALALARRNRRVLLVETDTYSAMAELFNKPVSGSELIRASDDLWLVNLRAEDALVETIKRFVPSERVARGVMGNRVAKVFFKAAPSVNEFVLLHRVHDMLNEQVGGRPRYDHIVVDLPASGHAVTFLSVPRTLQGMMRVGGFARLAGEIGAVIEDPEKTGIVAVCLPEEMPVNETLELAESFRETLGRPLTLAMLNMVHTEPFDMASREAFTALRATVPATMRVPPETTVDRLLHGNGLALDWYDRDAHYVRLLHERLGAPVVDMPIFYEPDGGLVLRRLAGFLNGEEPELASKLAS